MALGESKLQPSGEDAVLALGPPPWDRRRMSPSWGRASPGRGRASPARDRGGPLEDYLLKAKCKLISTLPESTQARRRGL